MLSDRYKCIFVHVPKTAGQSVEDVFIRLHGLTWETRSPLLLRHNLDRDKGPERLAHLTAREYYDLGYVSQGDFRRYFKFAFVRNPWDRLVSEFRYRGFEAQMSFPEFVDRSIPPTEGYSDLSRHIYPQYTYVIDPKGQVIVNFIGRFETLQDDFAKVARHLDLGETALPHRNKSVDPGITEPQQSQSKRPYQEFYDDTLRDRVAEYYAADIRLFGYRFDGSFQSGPILRARKRT